MQRGVGALVDQHQPVALHSVLRGALGVIPLPSEEETIFKIMDFSQKAQGRIWP